ncbi:hypothetical protein EVAR_69190_1 [Eumeta japonica]|uniref:Endonuclease-reverse transcriptase n=1 Tax=Eumeta variegata TaxID=151549 RepID=A0A4C2AE38_EUMVA|nr:hypothetical protein EVAR_69190_1 [Eumeta japonica]
MEEDPLLLEFMTQSSREEQRVGLEINISKTKMMTNCRYRRHNHQRTETQIKKDLDTCILPCITYGCETWALTKQHRDKLRARGHGEEHARFETIGQRKRHQKKTKVTDILSRIDQLKWRWAGHISIAKGEMEVVRQTTMEGVGGGLCRKDTETRDIYRNSVLNILKSKRLVLELTELPDRSVGTAELAVIRRRVHVRAESVALARDRGGGGARALGRTLGGESLRSRSRVT